MAKSDNSAYSADIYNSAEFVNEITKNFIEDVNEETLLMGTFGFMQSIFQEQISNSVRTMAEMSNEPFPTRARYDTNIYSHAVNTDILDIDAVPATIKCRVGFLEKELLKNMTDNTFIIDRDSSFFIEDKEFHLEFDVILRRTNINVGGNNQVIYTAQYDFSDDNLLAHIDSPYLDPPMIGKFSGDTYVWVTCDLRQYSVQKLYKKIITNNPIDNKTIEFTFENQLAGFDIQAFESNRTVRLIPMPDGKPTDDTYYAYYEYLSSTNLDNSTIRVKFDRTSYEPALNSEVLVRIYTTLGINGNFSYGQDYTIDMIQSSTFNYNNVPVLLWPISDSLGGLNRKSIKELKRIIPKEALARGSITSRADLEGYFNRLDSEFIRTKIYPRIDNQRDRAFSAFLLMKENNVVVPTNTIPTIVKDSDYVMNYNGRYVVKPGQIMFYRNSSARATYISKEEYNYWKTVDDYIYSIKTKEITLDEVPEEFVKDVKESIDEKDSHFYYGSPFTTIINTEPHIYLSYYLMILSKKYPIEYNYINNNSILQFIGSSMQWERKYTETVNEEYVYHGSITLTQNVSADMGMIKLSEPEDKGDEPEIIENNILTYLVIYDDEKQPIAYFPGYLGSYINSIFRYKYQFDIYTDDLISEENHIHLVNAYIPGGDINGEEYQRDVFVNAECEMEMFILAKFIDEKGNLTTYGLGDKIGNIVSGLEDYSLLNSYNLKGVQFFTNYTHIINSTLSPLPDINIKDGTLDDKSDKEIDAKKTNFGARELSPNENKRYRISGRDIDTGITHEIILNKSDCMIAKVDIPPETILRYNSKGQLIDPLNKRDPDNKDGTWNIIVYGNSEYEATKGLYRFGDGTFLYLKRENVLEYYKFNYGLYNKTLYCFDDTNFGANAEWPQVIDNVLHRLRGYMIETDEDYSLKLKLPDDNGSLDYEDPIPDEPIKYILQTKRFYIKSIPVVRYSYINDEERIKQFISQLEKRREYINSALYLFEDQFGIDLKFFNTYGPSRTFFLDNGDALNKTNIVFKFRVKLEPGADKYTPEHIIIAIKEYIENISQFDNTHISLLIKYLNTTFKESTTYIDYEGFDEFGPEEKHINRIEPVDINLVPEFINVSTNDDLTPDIQINLV